MKIRISVVAFVVFGLIYAAIQSNEDRSVKASTELRPPLVTPMVAEMRTSSDSEETKSVAVPPTPHKISGDAPDSTDASLSDEAIRPPVTVQEKRSDAVLRRYDEIVKLHGSIGGKLLGERLDEFMIRSEIDSEWAPAAEAKVTEWFVKVVENPSYLVYSECVSQVCFVDSEMPRLEFILALQASSRDKIGGVGEDFLSGWVSVSAGKNYARLYFFRDTFEVSDL